MKKIMTALMILLFLFTGTAFGVSAFSNTQNSNGAAPARYEPCDEIHMHGSSRTPTSTTKESANGTIYRLYICDWCGGELWVREK